MVIIYVLAGGTLRFSEIHRKLPHITEANLTQDLRMLESHGVIHREVYPVVPPKVEYSLTDMGKEFLPILDSITPLYNFTNDIPVGQPAVLWHSPTM